MRKINIGILLLLLLLVTACSSSKSIEGNWQRDDDSKYSGMQISLEKLDNGNYRAKVTKADEEGVFAEGNVKWRDVKKVKENEFDLYDLGDAGQSYEMTLTYKAGEDELSLQSFDNKGEEGSSQKWTRVK
ncbi:hypothetical protein [Paenibacillus sp. sgz500992]|uniref:hypothetical protein n=1 Tax=Paenibacillus sp. sgz500992 TaxID=3242476 RepID=UPI0036D27183